MKSGIWVSPLTQLDRKGKKKSLNSCYNIVFHDGPEVTFMNSMWSLNKWQSFWHTEKNVQMHLNLKGNLQENDKTKINNIFKVEKVAYLKKYIFF
jgi:hypothetical protein